jgi:hypothetical protein
MRLVLRVLEETLWEVDGLIRSRIWHDEVRVRFRNPFGGGVCAGVGEMGFGRRRRGGGVGDVNGIGIRVGGRGEYVDGLGIRWYGHGNGTGVGVGVGDLNGVMNREEEEERDLNLQARLKNKLDRIVKSVDSLYAYSDLLDQWFEAEEGLKGGVLEGRRGR